MNRAEQILEFDRIKEWWANLALTQAAKEKIRTMEPSLSETELLMWQRQTSEARGMIEKCGNPPLTSFDGIALILDTAKKESCLTAEQLEMVGNTFTAIRRLKDYLNRCKTYDFSLAYYAENLEPCEEIREIILQQIRGGQVDDHATSLLFSIRRDLQNEETRMREKADQIMRSNKACMADSFSTLRNGHICIPVKKECRHKIAGIVMDKSASGNTIFVEPAAVSRHYETIQLLRIDEENEEMRILYELTDLILESLDVILQNMRTVETLDFAFSKGKLSLEYEGVPPQINTERYIRLTEARHPLMDREKCVPISFEIGKEISGIIITGPNTGGKTVTLKTVALLSLMGQCGLHLSAKEAEICMNANCLCDIGDGQNLSENLSTFSAHLKNILEILGAVHGESLVILDELGSGTDPTEGMGIAVAVLDEMKRSGALFLVTTHYPEIKEYARKTEGILNARMDFDRETLTPLYRLIIGESGESCAFSIAKRLGMSEKMLERASRAAYGAEYESHLPVGEAGARRSDGTIAGEVHSGGACASESAARLSVPSARPSGGSDTRNSRPAGSHIVKRKIPKETQVKRAREFQLGDSVMVYPDKKIGIVCETVNEKGILRVQLPGKKIWINHKRIKLQVAATELYPEDYDFSIVFDTVENRKLRHQMERKYVEGAAIQYKE